VRNSSIARSLQVDSNEFFFPALAALEEPAQVNDHSA
jgi:hypothetical protein